MQAPEALAASNAWNHGTCIKASPEVLAAKQSWYNCTSEHAHNNDVLHIATQQHGHSKNGAFCRLPDLLLSVTTVQGAPSSKHVLSVHGNDATASTEKCSTVFMSGREDPTWSDLKACKQK